MAEVVCDCYPGGFSPDSYEGPKEDCPVHGRHGVQAVAQVITDRYPSFDKLSAEGIASAVLSAGYVHRDKLAEELDRLAEDMAERVDWSDGRSNYGDNEAYEAAARTLRARAEEVRNG